MLYHLLESLRWIAALLRPVMPRSALKMSEHLGLGLALWDQPLPQVLQWGRLLPGGSLKTRPAPLPPDRDRSEVIFPGGPQRQVRPRASAWPRLVENSPCFRASVL